MTCREISEFLKELVSGELPAEVQVEFDAHISACGNCVEFVNQYRTTIVASRAAFDEPVDVPDELVHTILKAIRSSRP